MALTAKQAQFVREYLIDLNATQAAIRSGYSEATAGAIGHENLNKPEIAEVIARAMEERAMRTEITADRVLNELAKIGFSSLSDVTDWGIREVAFGYTDDGKQLRAEEIGDAAMVRYVDAPFVKPLARDALPDNIRAAVSEVSLGKDGFKIKMHDKVGALTQIGRHLGLFTDKLDAKVEGGLVINLKRFTPEPAEPSGD